jgi:hypothetical protein
MFKPNPEILLLSTPSASGSHVDMEWKVTRFCEFSSENGRAEVTFDLNLLRRLASLGIPFVVDLYPPGPPTEEPDESRD